VTENVKLTANDGTTSDDFGKAVSEFGSMGLIGAPDAAVGDQSMQGAAYVFRDLDRAAGTVTQNVKLIASDGAATDLFGSAVSGSGSTGLIGASNATIDFTSQRGAVYLFRNLDTATGTVTEDVKLIASDGAQFNSFGMTVALTATGLTLARFMRTKGVIAARSAR
jgi:hypothetical protein